MSDSLNGVDLNITGDDDANQPLCHCRHLLDEHGPDGTGCQVEGCDCGVFVEDTGR